MREMAFQPTEAKLPSFLCVGTQKAGTTTLHALLGLHPMIFLPPRKEVHYFSLHYGEGLEWYRNFFDSAGNKQITGEITPYYLFHPYVAERIANDLGKVRIIILLRDPVARALSHYSHAVRLGFEDLELKQALKLEKRRLTDSDIILKRISGKHRHHQECSYASRSLYREQVERFWHYFGSENVLILPSELFFSSPWECLEQMHKFLDLPALSRPADNKKLHTRKNKGNSFSSQLDPSIVKNLRERLDDSYQFVRNDLGWSRSLPWAWSC